MLSLGVEALCSAKRVEFFGFGASAAVAFDAQHKFFRLQISTAAYADPHLQNMSATSMGPGDVVVAISQSGRTTTLINAIEEVKKRGAIVITISPSNTPIAFAGTIPICIDAKEDIEIYTPLSSRIAHLVVIDVLAIGVAKHKGGDLQEHLLDLQIGLESLRAPINS
jgi:RpiR family carbohydrate utilization transcriptional regulator